MPQMLLVDYTWRIALTLCTAHVSFSTKFLILGIYLALSGNYATGIRRRSSSVQLWNISINYIGLPLEIYLLQVEPHHYVILIG